MSVQPEVPASNPPATHSTLRTLRRGWKVLALCTVIGAALALGLSILQTPSFQASATLYVTSGADDAASTAYQGSLASQQRVQSYSRLALSDAVIRQAISNAKLSMSVADARTHIAATSAEQTVLLTISAADPNKDTARDLANAVATSLTAYVNRLETPPAGGQPLARLTVVTPADTPSTAVSPKTSRNTVLGAVVGLIVGIAIVLVSFRFSDKVRADEDFKLVGEAPVLSAIPNERSITKREGFVDFRQGADTGAESFRRLRASLAYARVDSPPEVIVITSPKTSEGKTTTALNLAAAIAEGGKSVVLVDADLRKPQLHTRLGLVKDVGLTTALTGDAELADVLQPGRRPNLSVLTAGPTPPNPSELLTSRKMGRVLEELAQHFDRVIVDSAPTLPVSDTVELAQWADGIVMIGRSGKTKLGELRTARTRLEESGKPVIGFVHVGVRASEAGYGYYGTTS